MEMCGGSDSEDEDFQFLRQRRVLDFQSSDEDDSSFEVYEVPENASSSPINSYVYIDDYNTIEKVPIKNAPTHITTKKQQVNVVAIKSGLQYSRVEEMAKRIGMVVNENKTQVLCIHSSKFSEVKSYIRTKNGRIESTDNLKILGFRFNTACLLYTSPSPRDLSTSRMPSSA